MEVHGQDRLNASVGLAHGAARAVADGPIGRAVVDWGFNQIGGTEQDSALYQNSQAIGEGTTAGLLMLGAAGLGDAAAATEVAAPATEAESTTAVEGIYEFKAGSGRIYVGQSSNIPQRMEQHLASGKLLEADLATLRTTPVSGGKTAREIAEQMRINELGGIQTLENVRNPIGKARAYLLGGP